jgi:hypothetical protein
VHSTRRSVSVLVALALTAICSLNTRAGEHAYSSFVRSHLDCVIQESLDEYGPERTPMWLATIDTSTGQLPEKPLPRELRWYRKITSPQRFQSLLGSADGPRGLRS